MGEMRVVGIRVEPPNSQPVLLLRELEGERYLAIWIGQSEAASIALRQKGIEPPRPLTHDLMVNLIGAFERKLIEVRIIDMQEGTFTPRWSSTATCVSRRGRRTRSPWPCGRMCRSSPTKTYSPRPVC